MHLIPRPGLARRALPSSVARLVLLAACAAAQPVRADARGGAGAPAPPPRWAHVGATPEKFVSVDEEGARQELWAKDGRLHGLSPAWNKAGVKVREELYDRGVSRRRKDWYADGRWKYYAEWDERGQPIYQVTFAEDGKRQMEIGQPTADTPPDVPRFETDSVAPELVARADAYIVGKVGADYFAKNYRFLRGRSSFHTETPTRSRYFLRYEYAPLRKIDSDGLVTVELYDGAGVDTGWRSYVATVEQGRVFEPTFTRVQALDLAAARFPKAKREWMHPIIVTPGWFWGEKLRSFTWAVYVNLQEPGAETGVTVTVFIDTVSGQYVGQSERGWSR